MRWLASWLWRCTASPWATIGSVAVFVSLCAGDAGSARVCGPRPITLTLIQTPEGMRAVELELVAPSDQLVAQVSWATGEVESRLLFPIGRRRGTFLYILGGLTPKEDAEARHAVLEAIASSPETPAYATTEALQRAWNGRDAPWRLDAFGLAANLLLPLLVILFIRPLYLGVQRTARANAAGRRRASLGRGLCPRCRYDIRGLPQHTCPECGNHLTP